MVEGDFSSALKRNKDGGSSTLNLPSPSHYSAMFVTSWVGLYHEIMSMEYLIYAGQNCRCCILSPINCRGHLFPFSFPIAGIARQKSHGLGQLPNSCLAWGRETLHKFGLKFHAKNKEFVSKGFACKSLFKYSI
ncbi:Uncharacterized protein TCM_006645 [Theobroma cacao]|uniref:Uncharacterized protein n=1 Tax=Theobroma cacao TaxID=3641 RepID=A0A061E080_THECC|nr:Uncharacterized protein TCM_006645 [Theobroma cacao]